MKTTTLAFTLIISTLSTSVFAETKTKSGTRGTATQTITQDKNTYNSSTSVQGANGKGFNSDGSVSVTKNGLTEEFSATTNSGATVSASGTTTNNNDGTYTQNTTVTGPKGNSKSNSRTFSKRK